jgi:hypothetical protein
VKKVFEKLEAVLTCWSYCSACWTMKGSGETDVENKLSWPTVAMDSSATVGGGLP